jgi:hypothetical protein
MENDAIVDAAAFLTAVAYTLTFFRAVLRRLKHEKFKPDDCLMVVALLFYTISTASYSIVVSFLQILLT